VTVDYHIRKREDHWSVTAFLVNMQEEHKRSAAGKDSLWLFPARLSVRSPYRTGHLPPSANPAANRGRETSAGYLEAPQDGNAIPPPH